MSNSSSHDAESVESISKTSLKREAEQLQKLGKRIAELSNDVRVQLLLPVPLISAINDYNRFRSREARRRQLQFLGRVMRTLDIEFITSRLDDLEGQSAKARFLFHQTEQWRDRLINEPQALAQYIDQHPQVDRQALRHALKKVRDTKTSDQSKSAARVLFRFLRDTESP